MMTTQFYQGLGNLTNSSQPPSVQDGSGAVYPPRSSDEIRLTLILERIERRLTAIEKRLDELIPTKVDEAS